MWQCHKCSKPVFFAERKQSLGYDWHPECLRCEECGKRLNPGQHAEHKGVPYCHVPCYGALFGPQLFGHGTRVESHKSFGVKGSTPRAMNNGSSFPRDHLESKLKLYNEQFEHKSQEIKCREVNGRLVLEGALRVYWGVQGVIHLKEDDDQRTLVTVRKRNSVRYSNSADLSTAEKSLLGHSNSVKESPDANDINETGIEISTSSILGGGDTTDISMSESISFDTCSFNEEIHSLESGPSSKEVSPDHKSLTLPSKLQVPNLEWDELDDLLQVERRVEDGEKLYQTMPSPLPSRNSSTGPDVSESQEPLLLSEQEQTVSSVSDESPKSDTDYKSAVLTVSQDDTTGTLTTLDKTSEEYLTPMNTLKPVDFEDFKKQMREEFIQNSSQLQNVKQDTLKANQPIDPSRINDSLKLYSENLMSKSFSGEPALRVVPNTFQYQTLKNNSSNSESLSVSAQNNYVLKKCGSAATTSESESFNSTENSINRSKSGPNWYRNMNGNESDDSSDTLKPSTIKRQNISPRSIHIKMDCYDELSLNNGSNNLSKSSSSGSGTTTTITTPTSPNNNVEYLRYDNPPGADDDDNDGASGVVVLRKQKAGSTAIKRRSGNKRSRAKLKRRCSINGHFYNRETSFFTPPHGSQMSVWITSLVSTTEVINLLLEKYKVESRPENFALFVVRDNGEQRRLKEDESPLMTRIMLGPHEDVSRIFITDAYNTSEISSEVAQFLNLSVQECRSILDRYEEEKEREVQKIRERYAELRRRIVQRMDSLKVRL